MRCRMTRCAARSLRFGVWTVDRGNGLDLLLLRADIGRPGRHWRDRVRCKRCIQEATECYFEEVAEVADAGRVPHRRTPGTCGDTSTPSRSSTSGRSVGSFPRQLAAAMVRDRIHPSSRTAHGVVAVVGDAHGARCGQPDVGIKRMLRLRWGQSDRPRSLRWRRPKRSCTSREAAVGIRWFSHTCCAPPVDAVKDGLDAPVSYLQAMGSRTRAGQGRARL